MKSEAMKTSFLRRLQVSRLALFQLVLLTLAFGVLYILAVKPWLAHRAAEQGRQSLQRAVGAFEARTASLDPADYAPDAVPDSQNAAHWAIAGAAAVVDDGGFLTLLSSFAREPEAFDQNTADQTNIDADIALALNQPALSLLHRMAGLSQSDFGLDYDRGVEMRLPVLGDLYAAGSLLAFNSVVAASRDDWRETAVSLRSLDVLAGAVAREAPQPMNRLAIDLETLFVRTLRAVTRPALDPTAPPGFADLRDIADQPPHAGGPCHRALRQVYFDAASRLVPGPSPELLKRLRQRWLPVGRRSSPETDWALWARHALVGVAQVGPRCDQIAPPEGMPGFLPQGGMYSSSSRPVPAEPTRASADGALAVLQPELFGFIEITRRARQHRTLAVVALTLLEVSHAREIQPAIVLPELPSLVADPIARELASCVVIETRADAGLDLVPVRNETCQVWTHESLRWAISLGADP